MTRRRATDLSHRNLGGSTGATITGSLIMGASDFAHAALVAIRDSAPASEVARRSGLQLAQARNALVELALQGRCHRQVVEQGDAVVEFWSVARRRAVAPAA